MYYEILQTVYEVHILYVRTIEINKKRCIITQLQQQQQKQQHTTTMKINCLSLSDLMTNFYKNFKWG